MNDSIKKVQIRNAIRGMRTLLSPEQIKEADRLLAEQFIEVADKDLRKMIASAECIALYKAVNGELPCDGIADFFLQNNRTICYPRVKGDTMDFYEINDPDKDFEKGTYGIPEPKSGMRKIYPSDIDLMIVPAVAYNEEGMRLGQGGGYYDRFLNACDKAGKVPFTVGVCYDFQMYSALPVEKHDRPVDSIMCVFTGENMK